MKSLVMLLALAACAHRTKPVEKTTPNATSTAMPSKSTPGGSNPIEFAAMGTVWRITLESDSKTFSKKALKEKLLNEVVVLERAFSDWTNDSELRRLEIAGLTTLQTPSPLFMSGLRLAQEAYQLTHGTFDITIGAVQWRALSTPVGLGQLRLSGSSFRFQRDPKRLTFGGLIKGAATGRLARILVDAGATAFSIDAGGGNEAHLTAGATEVHFVSQSNSHQEAKQHIFDPQNPRKALRRFAIVRCESPLTARANWFREAGLADALSTALVVDTSLSDLPANCQVKFEQAR